MDCRRTEVGVVLSLFSFLILCPLHYTNIVVYKVARVGLFQTFYKPTPIPPPLRLPTTSVSTYPNHALRFFFLTCPELQLTVLRSIVVAS